MQFWTLHSVVPSFWWKKYCSVFFPLKLWTTRRTPNGTHISQCVLSVSVCKRIEVGFSVPFSELPDSRVDLQLVHTRIPVLQAAPWITQFILQTSTGVVIGSNYVLLSNAAWSVVARTSQLKETGAVFQLTQWLPTCTDILCSVIHIGTSAEGQIIGSIYRGYRGIIGYLLALKK